MSRHTGSSWGGRRAATWSADVLDTYGRSCWLQLPGCTGYATTADHLLTRSERPDLAYVVANGRPACLHCNSARNDTPLHLLDTIGGRARTTIDASGFFE